MGERLSFKKLSVGGGRFSSGLFVSYFFVEDAGSAPPGEAWKLTAGKLWKSPWGLDGPREDV
jgi:hypothetical protein